ncbi:hypothetical protein [Clostridium sp. UBA871]
MRKVLIIFLTLTIKKIIDEDHLPINFDAKKGNATRKAFDDGEL